MKNFAIRNLLVLAAALVLSACGGGGGGSGGGSGGSGQITAVTIHYMRITPDYTGWGLHLYNTSGAPASIASSLVTTWTTPHAFDGVSSGWAYAQIPLINAQADLNFIVHMGDVKSPTGTITITPQSFGADVWVVQDVNTAFATQSAAQAALAQVGHASNSLDLSAVTAQPTSSGLAANWSKSANFMEIFVRSYKDSNGDGIGDLQGLISQLDYLKAQGVTGLYLMPVFASSDHDHGYAVVDYRSIEPDYGTLSDFDALIKAAHQRGIGIVLDYVMNHSSNQNPVFLDAMSDPTNPKRNWYLFQPTNPGWTGFGGVQSWRQSESGWYYGIFDTTMPDWNLTNPTVVAYHMDNLKFWLNRGVDGFRFDAAEYFIENGPNAWQNQPQDLTLMQQAAQVINGYPNRFIVCEAPDAPASYASACGSVFAFGQQTAIINTATSGSLDSGLAAFLQSPGRAAQPLFLSNHDSFAGARPYNALMGHNEGDYHVAAAIEILAADTPFAYYGEEVGEANGALSGDPALRIPMSWTANTTNAGFTTGTPYRALSTNVADHNVAAETGVSTSLLTWYSQLWQLRLNNPVLASGAFTLRSSAGASYLAFTRSSGGQTAVVVINLSTSSQSVAVSTGLSSTSFHSTFPSSGANASSNGSGILSVSVPAQGVVAYLTP